jgi:hypothetical protein
MAAVDDFNRVEQEVERQLNDLELGRNAAV